MPDPYQLILEKLSACKRVLVTTHIRPDGDALGTSAAMVLGMRAKGIDAHVLLMSHLPSKYAFVFNDLEIAHSDIESAWPDSAFFQNFDALLVVDTGTWSQLPGLKEHITHWQVPKLVVDHHLTQEDWADAKLLVTEAAAAGEIAAELLQQWGVEFTLGIARALFLAIVSDTGWFQYSSTRAYTLRLGAQLIEAGVDTDEFYQLLYQNERAERIALQTRAQQSLELLADNRLAVMQVSKADFELTGGKTPDTENLINIPLQIRTIEVSLLFTEPMDGGAIRVSLRSKGHVDVARFAEQFGGGGHARAAGLKVVGTLHDVQGRVVSAMIARLQIGG